VPRDDGAPACVTIKIRGRAAHRGKTQGHRRVTRQEGSRRMALFYHKPPAKSSKKISRIMLERATCARGGATDPSDDHLPFFGEIRHFGHLAHIALFQKVNFIYGVSNKSTPFLFATLKNSSLFVRFFCIFSKR